VHGGEGRRDERQTEAECGEEQRRHDVGWSDDVVIQAPAGQRFSVVRECARSPAVIG
jgi:hypothetical protein